MGVSPITTRGTARNLIIIGVETDVNIHGWSESVVVGCELARKGLTGRFCNFLIGKDPR